MKTLVFVAESAMIYVVLLAVLFSLLYLGEYLRAVVKRALRRLSFRRTFGVWPEDPQAQLSVTRKLRQWSATLWGFSDNGTFTNEDLFDVIWLSKKAGRGRELAKAFGFEVD